MKQRKFKLSPETVVQFEKREHETHESLELKRLQAVRLYGSGVDMTVVQQVSMASRRIIQRWGVEGREVSPLQSKQYPTRDQLTSHLDTVWPARVC